LPFMRPLPVTLRGCCMDVQSDFAPATQYCETPRKSGKN